MSEKHCCRCCGYLNDNCWTLYEYNGDLYCRECLADKIIEDGLVEIIEEPEEDEEI